MSGKSDFQNQIRQLLQQNKFGSNMQSNKTKSVEISSESEGSPSQRSLIHYKKMSINEYMELEQQSIDKKAKLQVEE